MSDLIGRQAAIDAMCCACGYDCDKSKFVYNAPQDEQVIMCPEHYALSTLPSAQPRKGKWIEHDDGWANVYYECSVCKEPFVLIDGTPAENLYNFCPNCGADMREGDAE